MIREAIEKDIALMEHIIPKLAMRDDEDAKDILRAWIKIQLHLYRYDSLLNHVEELDGAEDDFYVGYYLSINRAGM